MGKNPYPNRRFKWIFFDLFDTLCAVDEAVYYEGKREAARAADVDYEPFLAAWRATSPEASVGKLRDPFSRAARALEMMGTPDRRAAATLAQWDIETIQRCVTFYGGATEALARLRASGFSLGLISNATATTAFVVSPLHLRDRLDLLVFSYEAGAAKPDPRIFQKAIERAKCSPAEALFIGDGANRELDAAREFGMATLCLDHPQKASSFRNPDGLSSPDHPRVGSFEEMAHLTWIRLRE